jgi:hypothetical protein
MAYIDTALPVDIAAALRRIDGERKGRAILAAFGIAALLTVALGATYASYKDVPSPADPANGKGHLVTPYGY